MLVPGDQSHHDRHLNSGIGACYNLQYLDKTLSKLPFSYSTNSRTHSEIVNYANVMGLQEDTSITGNQFSLLATLFYITYLAFEFPTGYLMQRLPTAKYLGANVILWVSGLLDDPRSSSW